MTTRDDLVSRLRDAKMGDAVKLACDLDDLCQLAATALEAKDAEIARLTAERAADASRLKIQRDNALLDMEQFMNKAEELEHQLAEETERCASYLDKIADTHRAKAKRTTSPSTKAAFDKAVFLRQLAAAIRGGTK